MSYFYFIIFVVFTYECYGASTHDDLPQCGYKGTYKTRQSLLQSPNYPNQYPPNSCWDYVVRSPYRCPTKFHIQFLDFYLEASKNCTNDYLAIGVNDQGDDMDLLCGEIVGIKKYFTLDGVLRLRFYADDSPWTTGKGFKILITRLACESNDYLKTLIDRDDTETIESSSSSFINVPQQNDVNNLLGNISLQEQYQEVLPPLYPGLFPQQPCANPQYSNALQQQWLFRSGDVPTSRQNLGEMPRQIDFCCQNIFQQDRMYLSSPGFPRTVLTSLLPRQRRDCYFQLAKYKANVCHLRIEFKFFDFGRPYSVPGASTSRPSSTTTGQSTTADVCTEDFIELDGFRYCGCRTGFVTKFLFNFHTKSIHMRMGYSGLPSNGFLLEISQEECGNGAQQGNGPFPTQSSIIQNNLPIAGLQPNFYNPYQQIWPQQQQLQQFGFISPFRQSKVIEQAETSQQPIRVVETNSTRKEMFFLENSQNNNNNEAQDRSDVINDDYNDNDVISDQKLYLRDGNRCNFSSGDLFQLLIDPLWLRKPTCYATQNRMLDYMFG